VAVTFNCLPRDFTLEERATGGHYTERVWAPMLVCLVALCGRIFSAPTGGRSPIIRSPSPWLIHCTN